MRALVVAVQAAAWLACAPLPEAMDHADGGDIAQVDAGLTARTVAR